MNSANVSGANVSTRATRECNAGEQHSPRSRVSVRSTSDRRPEREKHGSHHHQDHVLHNVDAEEHRVVGTQRADMVLEVRWTEPAQQEREAAPQASERLGDAARPGQRCRAPLRWRCRAPSTTPSSIRSGAEPESAGAADPWVWRAAVRAPWRTW